MIKKYQVTLFSSTGKYKPVASIVNWEQSDDIDYSNNREVRKLIQREGVKKICAKRYWTLSDLRTYGFTKYKIRVYEKP